jgi:hypothetical protein
MLATHVTMDIWGYWATHPNAQRALVDPHGSMSLGGASRDRLPEAKSAIADVEGGHDD